MTMNVTVGYQVHHSENIALSLRSGTDDGFNYIVTSLVHPRSKKFVPYSDIFVDGSERGNKLVINIPKRNYCLKSNVTLLEREFNYASHIGVTQVLIDCPDDRLSLKTMADIINRQFTSSSSEAFGEHTPPSIYVRIPLVAPKSLTSTWRDSVAAEEFDEDEMWNKWNFIRMITQSNPRLFLALELNGDPPDQERVNRWLGEPVVMLILPTSIFLTNSSKYPVLSKAYQNFIAQLNFKIAGNFSFLIRGNNLHSHLKHYVQYLNHMKSSALFVDKISKFTRGYEDVLQIPLQPLKDNLDSLVYEVFETDDIKYQQYELAIYKALMKIDKDDIVAMVVGAGRGPLVEKTLKAAARASKYVTIYAVEKNANAIVTLEALRDLRWGGAQPGLPEGIVQIVNEDMRTWEAPRKADLLISELLGSFADNELSPECLDGVWRYVRSDTISIPASYNSYLCPVQSHKLFAQLHPLETAGKKGSSAAYEYGYVVHVRNAYVIDEPQVAFNFTHADLTKRPSERDNSRSKVLTFTSKLATVVHGFVGYFDCCLFTESESETVYLSTVPATKNEHGCEDMYSWFPIYFPLASPVAVGAGQSIQLHLTRNTDAHQVWYEWTLLEPIISKVHNTKGKYYSISLH